MLGAHPISARNMKLNFFFSLFFSLPQLQSLFFKKIDFTVPLAVRVGERVTCSVRSRLRKCSARLLSWVYTVPQHQVDLKTLTCFKLHGLSCDKAQAYRYYHQHHNHSKRLLCMFDVVLKIAHDLPLITITQGLRRWIWSTLGALTC